MFIGEYSYTIDHKKRLAIPSKFRKELGKKAVITHGLDNCLVIYSLKVWDVLAKKLEGLPLSRRGFSRIMFSGAIDVSFDKLGRILIPDRLKKYGFLKKNVSIIGMSDKIEIWDEKNWQKYKQGTEKEIGDMAEQLEELGI